MEQIRVLRRKAGLSGQELGQKLGVSRPTVTRWERGVAYPSAERLPALADALGCTIDALFGREEVRSA